MSTSEPELSEGTTRNPWVSVGAWVLCVAALVAAFGYNLSEMWLRWFPGWRRANLSLYDRIVGGESYYTHGPIIPAVSLLITVLLIRHVRMPVRPSRMLGGIVLALSLLLHLVACLARVNFASGFALIGVLVGLVLVLWGSTVLRQLWFPIAFLVFMVPLPEVSIAQLNFRLKMFASDWGVTLANTLGMIAERVGNRVFLEGDKSLVIANVCNGLRTLISLLAFGSLYAYVCRLRGLWRVGLFAMTIPVALVSNSLRVVSLIVVADIWDAETASGWYHDLSGALIFVLAFLLMFSMERLILWMRKAMGRPAKILPLFHGRLRGPEDEGQWLRMLHATGSARAWTAGVVMVLVAGCVSWLSQTVPPALTPDLVEQAVPAVLNVQGRQLHSYKLDLDEKTLTILEYPSYLLRRYVSAGNPPIDFCLIFSKDNRKGTHPPDLCLEGGGAGIVAMADIVLSEVDGRGDLPCRELVVETGKRKEYFLYTYKCGNQYTRSFWVQQSIIFANGLLRRDVSGALIRVSTPVIKSESDARQRCVQMLRALVPYLDENLR